MEILDRWRMDDEWWRKEISRMYFHVALAPLAGEGVVAAPFLLTIFHDLTGGGWFLQTTATPQPEAEPVHILAPRIPEVRAAAVKVAEGEEPWVRPTPIRRVG